MASNQRSPIKDKPLRQAGQSLEEERRALWEDKIEPYLLIALMLVMLAALEWWRWYDSRPPNPVLFGLVALVSVALAVWKVWRHRPHMKALRLGADGEKAVGQFLDRMREREYQVFHDIIGPGFNVDHVLIGPAGIFTIETKTWSKPAKGDARITFKEGRLLAADHPPDRDPIVQARAQAKWLGSLLAETTGKTFNAMELPAFRGHYSERKKESSYAQVKGAVPGAVSPTNGGTRPRRAQAQRAGQGIWLPCRQHQHLGQSAW